MKKEIAYFAQTRKRYWFIILLVFSALNYGNNAVPKVFFGRLTKKFSLRRVHIFCLASEKQGEKKFSVAREIKHLNLITDIYSIKTISIKGILKEMETLSNSVKKARGNINIRYNNSNDNMIILVAVSLQQADLIARLSDLALAGQPPSNN